MKYKDIKDQYKEYMVTLSVVVNPMKSKTLSIDLDDLAVIDIDCDIEVIVLRYS